MIEVADTSLRCDLNTKAPIYATHGVREYWVIAYHHGAQNPHSEPYSPILMAALGRISNEICSF